MIIQVYGLSNALFLLTGKPCRFPESYDLDHAMIITHTAASPNTKDVLKFSFLSMYCQEQTHYCRRKSRQIYFKIPGKAAICTPSKYFWLPQLECLILLLQCGCVTVANRYKVKKIISIFPFIKKFIEYSESAYTFSLKVQPNLSFDGKLVLCYRFSTVSFWSCLYSVCDAQNIVSVSPRCSSHGSFVVYTQSNTDYLHRV